MRLDNTLKAKLIYLFLLADGECSTKEKVEFETLCKTMKIDETERAKFVNYYENRFFKNDNSAEIIQEMYELLEKSSKADYQIGFIVRGLLGESELDIDSLWSNQGKREQLELIWAMVNLGYADTEFSVAEQRVIRFLANHLGVDSAVYTDMLETAETILALVEQENWLKTSRRSSWEINNEVAKIEKIIEQMYANIEQLLLEAEVA